jgi:hypothetical protein
MDVTLVLDQGKLFPPAYRTAAAPHFASCTSRSRARFRSSSINLLRITALHCSRCLLLSPYVNPNVSGKHHRLGCTVVSMTTRARSLGFTNHL